MEVIYAYNKENIMNICILMGKIISEIQFEFIIKEKNNIYSELILEYYTKADVVLEIGRIVVITVGCRIIATIVVIITKYFI